MNAITPLARRFLSYGDRDIPPMSTFSTNLPKFDIFFIRFDYRFIHLQTSYLYRAKAIRFHSTQVFVPPPQ